MCAHVCAFASGRLAWTFRWGLLLQWLQSCCSRAHQREEHAELGGVQNMQKVEYLCLRVSLRGPRPTIGRPHVTTCVSQSRRACNANTKLSTLGCELHCSYQVHVLGVAGADSPSATPLTIALGDAELMQSHAVLCASFSS